MNYSNIIYYDTANSHGLATVLFVSGCDAKCPGCHNKVTWDFKYGKEFNSDVADRIINSMNSHIKNLVVSGGEPLHPNNISTVYDFLRRFRQETNDKNIILYTGYCIKDLCYDGILPMWKNKWHKEIMRLVDYVIDGKFEQNNAVHGIELRGSTNQQCYHIKHHDTLDSCYIENVTDTYFS